MKWRRFGQVEKKEEEGARNPATTIMKKAIRTPVAPAMATAAKERQRGRRASIRTQQTTDNIPLYILGEGDCPTFLSPPVRHQRRRRSGENFVGRSKWKKKRKGGIFGFALQPPQ